jgi:hypothetical protein
VLINEKGNMAEEHSGNYTVETPIQNFGGVELGQNDIVTFSKVQDKPVYKGRLAKTGQQFVVSEMAIDRAEQQGFLKRSGIQSRE